MLGRFGSLAPVLVQNAHIPQQRGMATLKALSIRRKSVQNMQKITQSMKMVSASKFTRAERELKAARPIGAGASDFYDKAEITPLETVPQQLYIAITSDRGLCGAVHTNVAKLIRGDLEKEGAQNIKVVCVGDKSKLILQRLYSKHILFAANEVGRLPPTFLDASRVTSAIFNSGYEYSSGKIVYNKFRTVVSCTTKTLPVFSLAAVEVAPKLAVYDSLDKDVIQSYLEFSLTALIYYALKESACSEQSSRMTAMENASKNAGDMIKKLTLMLNRTRQAVITNELIEIISGAAAL